MRIDLTAIAAVQADAPQASKPQAVARRQNVKAARTISQQTQPEKPVETPSPRKSVPLPEPAQLNVSMDDRRNVIYRFIDPKSGETIRQVPPEEILKVMRNIEDLLHESEQKLKVTL